MEHQKKKTPADYPQFAFRLSSNDQKERLNKMIEAVQAIYNRGLDKETEKKINKNDIIVEALEIGLSTMKKRKQ